MVAEGLGWVEQPPKIAEHHGTALPSFFGVHPPPFTLLPGPSGQKRPGRDRWRWKALSQSAAGGSLEVGIQWQALGKARKKLKGFINKALVAVWQEAIRHRAGTWCARCDQAASLQHVMWDCGWWNENQQEPEDFPRLCKPDSRRLRVKRALLPTSKAVKLCTRIACYGVFQEPLFEADGNPEDTIQVVGSASGPVAVACEQTVFWAPHVLQTVREAAVQPKTFR